MREAFDAIVIGAGSVGIPTAFYLTLKKLKVLVIEKHPSPGQGQNKSAIGGVRATHSDPAKILIGSESLEIFKTWEEIWGDAIGWKEGGYCFPVYRTEEENTLKSLLPVQKEYNLSIDWVDEHAIQEIIPGINPAELRGGTYSPEDGQVSPLLCIDSMYRAAAGRGCSFRFGERVRGITCGGGKIREVQTDKGSYSTRTVVNAAGASAADIGRMTGIDLPVRPESHEAGISSPVRPFLKALVVDMRPGVEGKTANFYFGQVREGPIIFCYTPKNSISGLDREPRSEFLPVLAGRLIQLLPRCRNLLIRRVWRGLYPMTPDGNPICGKVREIDGLYLAAGMCGQGFMLGPGMGKNMASLIAEGKALIPKEIFDTIGLYRNFQGTEKEALT